MKTNDRFTRSIVILVTLLLFLLSCGENNSNKESSDNIAKLTGLKDSANSLKNIETDKAIIDDLVANLDEIKDTIGILEKSKIAVEDSLNVYTSILTEINIKIDDIQKKKKYVSETNEKNKNKVTTNIADLEAYINSLKISKSNKESELKLIDKRKDLISKKSEALKTELDYKQSELKEFYSQQNAQAKIKEVNESIVKISSEISANNNQLLEEELNQKLLKNKIASIDTEIKTNQSQFKTEYEKSTGLDDYVKEEGMTLDTQIKKLELLKTMNSDKWKTFKDQKNKIEAEIDQFKIEMSEISLNSDQDIKPAANTSQNEIQQTKTDQKLINSSSAEESSEMGESDEKLNDQEDTSSSYIYWLLLIIVAVVSILYWVGKKNKSTKN